MHTSQPTFLEELHQARVRLDNIYAVQDRWAQYPNRQYPAEELLHIHNMIQVAVLRLCHDTDLSAQPAPELPLSDPVAHDFGELEKLFRPTESITEYVANIDDLDEWVLYLRDQLGGYRTASSLLSTEIDIHNEKSFDSGYQMNQQLDQSLSFLVDVIKDLFEFAMRNIHGSQLSHDLFFDRCTTGASRPTKKTLEDIQHRCNTLLCMKQVRREMGIRKNADPFISPRLEALEERQQKISHFLRVTGEQKADHEKYVGEMMTYSQMLIHLSGEAGVLQGKIRRLKREHHQMALLAQKDKDDLLQSNNQIQIHERRWGVIVAMMMAILEKSSGPFPFRDMIIFFEGSEWKEDLDSTDFHTMGDEWNDKDNTIIYRDRDEDVGYMKRKKAMLKNKIHAELELRARYVGGVRRYTQGRQLRLVNERHHIYVGLLLDVTKKIENLLREYRQIKQAERSRKENKKKKTTHNIYETMDIRTSTEMIIAQSDLHDIVGLLEWMGRRMADPMVASFVQKIIQYAQKFLSVCEMIDGRYESPAMLRSYFDAKTHFCNEYSHYRNHIITRIFSDNPLYKVVRSTLYRIESKSSMRHFRRTNAHMDIELSARSLQD